MLTFSRLLARFFDKDTYEKLKLATVNSTETIVQRLECVFHEKQCLLSVKQTARNSYKNCIVFVDFMHNIFLVKLLRFHARVRICSVRRLFYRLISLLSLEALNAKIAQALLVPYTLYPFL